MEPTRLISPCFRSLPAAINFGRLFTRAETEFAMLAKARPNGPKMNGEYWDGWFDHWGEKHHTTDAAADAARPEMDAGAGLLSEPVYGPWGNELWLDERR